MPRLLLGHAGDLGRIGAAIAHHSELPGIDPGRAEFACLVDADHAGNVIGYLGHARRSFISKRPMASPAADETRKL